MLKRSDLPRRAAVWVPISACFALILAFLFCSLSTQAHAASHAARAGGPTFRVNAGFDSRFRDGNWIPVQVTLRNDGPNFNGKISVNVPPPYAGTGNNAPISIYQEVVNLPTGAQKQVTLYAPFYLGAQGATLPVTVDLLNSDGQKVGTQQTALRSLGPTDIFIGVLSDQQTGFGPLSALTLPNQTSSIFMEPLSAATMPTIAAALKNFDLIIMDNFTTSTLSKEQLAALQNWVQEGGSLIVVGGPEWRATLTGLPARLLPVAVTGSDVLPPGTALLPVGGPERSSPGKGKVADSVSDPVIVSTGNPLPGASVALNSNVAPLIVQSQVDQGLVCYVAFDPTLQPIVNWSSATALWKGLLLRTLGDQLLTSTSSSSIGSFAANISSYYNGGMDTLLRSLFPTSFPGTWLILILLASYVVVLGPVRLFIVRWLKKRDWSWRIALSTIVVFSLLTYGLALQQKGNSIISSSISVIQLDRSDRTSTAAHVTTYVGVFVPNQGDFLVHIPGFSLVQPSNNRSPFYRNQPAQQPATITTAPDGVDVKLQGVDIWTVRSLVSEHDSQIQGGIVSHLTLRDNRLVGTVTNVLPYALSDVYVLMDDHYLGLGHMAARQTRVVNLSMEDTNSNVAQNMSLADQIANGKGLPVPYGPYYDPSHPLTELQRHIAMLETLSGETAFAYCGNGPCLQVGRIVTSNGTVTVSSPFSPGSPLGANSIDPLLIPDAPATLIGWADQGSNASGAVTINGNYSSKVQESLIQAPLNIGYAGTVNLPSDAVSGQLVDVENGNNGNVQMQFPGVYTMTTGSMTFEFTLPSIPNLRPDVISIQESTNLPQIMSSMGGAAGPPVDVTHLHSYLYNWRTGSWDTISMQGFSFSTSNVQAYVGPGGRVLLQFANQDTSVGMAVLSKPSLQLQGTIMS
jgi:hypothetical protein